MPFYLFYGIIRYSCATTVDAAAPVSNLKSETGDVKLNLTRRARCWAIGLTMAAGSLMGYGAEQLNFRSSPMTAGKASLSENGYIVSRELGGASFSPELRYPVRRSAVRISDAQNRGSVLIFPARRTSGTGIRAKIPLKRQKISLFLTSAIDIQTRIWYNIKCEPND